MSILSSVRHFLYVFLATLFVVLASTGPIRAGAVKLNEVKVVSDLAYNDAADAHKTKQILDLYLPQDVKDFPVVLFVHGGGWRHGDKDFFGVYRAVGSMFARHGIGAVVINYRLSPEFKHPEHVQDVAKAFAWTHKNIGKYGGRADQIFVSGHSAGGHLVSLLATDDSYMKAEGLKRSDLRGVIPISGVYQVADDLTNTRIGKNIIESAFGKDEEVRKKAFPMSHVGPGLPPFLILYADRDLPGFDKMSQEFAKAIKDKKGQAEVLEIKKRNHLSVLIELSADDDPATKAVLDFIAARLKDDKPLQRNESTP